MWKKSSEARELLGAFKTFISILLCKAAVVVFLLFIPLM